jgi:Putative beta barrel porin-7 (BBP7)
MKHLLIRGLALSLGLLATSARGQETVWRSTPASPGATTPAVSTGKPIAIAVSRPATPPPTIPTAQTPKAPVAHLGRPLGIAGNETPVRPVSFTPTPDADRPIVRGAAPDALSRPMPAGTSTGDPMSVPSMSQGNWRRSDVVGVSRTATPEMDAIAAPPNGGGTIMPAPTPVPETVGMPHDQGVGGQPVMAGPPSSLFATNPDCGCGGGIKCGPVVDCAPGCGCGKAFVGGRMIASSGSCAGGTCGAVAGQPCSGADCGTAWGRYVAPLFGCLACDNSAAGLPQLTLNAEYLLWWMKGDRTPPLAVAVPTVGGLPSGMATNLIGGGTLGNNSQSGLRASAIYWFSEQHCWGLEVGGFFVGLQNQRSSAGGDSAVNPVIGRPFFDTSVGGAPALQLVAGLGLLQGNVEVIRRSTLWGYDINLRRNLYNDCNFTLDYLFGFRELGLDESLRISENLTQAAPFQGFPAGSNFLVTDKFSASNRFYGGQVGLAGLWRFSDNWSLGFTGKVAVGTTTQIVNITGSTTVTSGGITQTLPGGLLTQAGTNIGRYTNSRFGVVPEGGLTLGYNVTDWWRLTAGYNFLYWSNVVRPGQQVDLNVNRTLLPFRGGATVPGAQPAFLGRTSDFYAQGVTFGMLFSF